MRNVIIKLIVVIDDYKDMLIDYRRQSQDDVLRKIYMKQGKIPRCRYIRAT